MKLPYENWECFQAGLYRTQCEAWPDAMVTAHQLLSSADIEETMIHVVQTWRVSREHYFKQSESTWRPWMGHAACCFEIGCPNWVTKKAWHLLTADEQYQADSIARKVHGEWNGQGLLI